VPNLLRLRSSYFPEPIRTRNSFTCGWPRGMPHHFEFDSEHKILRLVLEGEIAGEEFVRLSAEIRAQAERLRPLAGITDGGGITSFNVSSQILRSAALEGSPYPSPTLRYIVASSDYLFGLARMYELIGNHSDERLQVVHKMEEALAELGAATAKFERVSD
jgi:hypothetical protein